MKTAILFTAAGAAAGAITMWMVLSREVPETGGKNLAAAKTTARLSSENQKLTERVQSLEKELTGLKKNKPSRASAEAEAAEAAARQPQVFQTSFDDSHMEEMMKQRAEREANREADKLALRLKLSPEQKESLKKFLLDAKERERAAFRSAMKNGGKVELPKDGQSKDEFLKGLLTPEQLAQYEQSQEEQRRMRAEEYAQRKVRKMNDELSLSEEQKDKLFQSFAQQKLAATDPAKVNEPGDVVTRASGGSIAFAAVGNAVGGLPEPVEIEFDSGDFALGAGGSDLDRSTLESILTPEQLAVHDQRLAEQQERAKQFQLKGLPGAGAALGGGAQVHIEVKAPPPQPVGEK